MAPTQALNRRDVVQRRALQSLVGFEANSQIAMLTIAKMTTSENERANTAGGDASYREAELGGRMAQ